MQMISVVSSTIQSIGYDEKNSVLRLMFRDGSVHDYYDVPDSVFSDLMRATSKGRYAKANIIERYTLRKII